MFQNETKENQMNVVQIEDFGVAPIRMLLDFLYSAKLPSEEQVDPELFAAANKYEVLELRDAIETKDVTLNNVMEVLEVAYFHDAKVLKTKALRFILDNMDDVKTLPKWQDFHERRPAILKDLFELNYGSA